MLPLRLGPDREPLRVLCLGAHSDDIEIGCAGTLLRWQSEYRSLDVTWAVFSAAGVRGDEARRSAATLLRDAAACRTVVGDLQDAHMPADFARAKAFVRGLAEQTQPDVILTHRLEDAHQDHRLVGELTWQTWRDHLILEYEIAKYEGDLGRPNLFVPLTTAVARRKIDHLQAAFESQRTKPWFRAETFEALMRIRGLECRADDGWAEAFHVRKGRL